MELNFSCPGCSEMLLIPTEYAGIKVKCPTCELRFIAPTHQPQRQAPVDSEVLPPPSPGEQGITTCPACWLKFSGGEVMHISVHDSLRGDPILGEEAPQRFLATRYDDAGNALDAMGLPATDYACPHCRRKLPPNFLELPQHIISLVGDASSGKSYYLAVLAKVLPAALFKAFDVTMQDADPTGNAALNSMKTTLFSGAGPEQTRLIKTQMQGAMYDRFPRHGRMVLLPKPFTYELKPRGDIPGAGLIFYDNAGEHFQPGINVVDNPGAQHVASAAGIMYLVDPFEIPDFRRFLGETTDPGIKKPPGDRQEVILSEIRTRVAAIQRLRPNQKIKAPLAVILGKCDAWLHLLPHISLDQPVQNNSFNVDALRKNSDMVRDLLRDICPGVVANAEVLSESVCYFPMSSFGHTPVPYSGKDGANGSATPDPKQINPVLAEVPPLWLLSQLAPLIVPTS